MTIVMKLLEEAIEKCDEKYAELSLKLVTLKLEMDEIYNARASYIKVLQEQCSHVKSKRVDGTYSPGGYDHVSEEHYTIECVNCGKVLDSKCIRGSYA